MKRTIKKYHDGKEHSLSDLGRKKKGTGKKGKLAKVWINLYV